MKRMIATAAVCGVSLFGFYVFNRARSNTDGQGTFPANPYDFTGEYGFLDRYFLARLLLFVFFFGQ